MREKRHLGDKLVIRDFLRTRWVWVVLAAAITLAAVIALVVVFPLFQTSTPAESHEADASEACQEDVARQLADEGTASFHDETTEEFGENTWHVNGTSRPDESASDSREYQCVYTGESLSDVTID